LVGRMHARREVASSAPIAPDARTDLGENA
jgi:hypothetical protein